MEIKIPYQVEPDKWQEAVGNLAKRIAKRLLNIEIEVIYYYNYEEVDDDYEEPILAEYNKDAKILAFNTANLPCGFFSDIISKNILDIILHELGHEKGTHIERSYQRALTQMAGELVMIALEDAEFFTKELKMRENFK